MPFLFSKYPTGARGCETPAFWRESGGLPPALAPKIPYFGISPVMPST